ncbi:hypothetical protein L596_021880 [Steinernema carpocapsae]|uniref:Uncharacterized protein n=1 Tax=Steinernema carpocapsae TaxID=34508 RepID=A0A4U5MKX0_STECR|nr:hypothetical protein L596_021880 [Steinernema carpocapsae]
MWWTIPFLLFLCAHGLPTDTKDPKTHVNSRTILCGLKPNSQYLFYNIYAAYWSEQKSDYVEMSNTFKDCEFNNVARLCRTAFKNVSHADEISGEMEEVDHDSWWKSENDEEKLTAKHQKYKCQEYIRAKELDIPKGSQKWSDRLRLDEQGDCSHDPNQICASRDELVRIASDECGKKLQLEEYTLGGKCGSSDIYPEIFFVCDKPKNDSFFRPTTFKAHREEAFHKSQLASLEQYAHVAEQLKLAKFNNETDKIKKLNQQLHDFSYSAASAIKQAHEWSHSTSHEHMAKEESWWNEAKLQNDALVCYRSREGVLEAAKEAARDYAVARSADLFTYAAALLSNETSEAEKFQIELDNYDPDEFMKSNGVPVVGLQKFPELKPQIKDYYVSYIMNHTLGIQFQHLEILNKTGGHAELVGFYQEIFNPGLINEKFLKAPIEHTIFEIYIVVAVISMAVLVGIFLWKNRNAQYKVVDLKVKFARAAFGPMGKDEGNVEVEKLESENFENPMFTL